MTHYGSDDCASPDINPWRDGMDDDDDDDVIDRKHWRTTC